MRFLNQIFVVLSLISISLFLTVLFGQSTLLQGQAHQEVPKIYVLASPPTSQVGLVFKGKYYSFGREPPEVQCDLRYDGACYWKTDVKFVQISKDIISINGGKAFGCSPSIIPDTSRIAGYESGYGKCTSEGWRSLRNDF